jgi:hypothetical protein
MQLKSCKIKLGLVTSLLVCLWTSTLSAKQFIELKGARFPAQKVTEAGRFSLQGAGILKWGIVFDVYAAAYYVDQALPQNQKLVIQYFVPITAQQIQTAAEKHILKQQGKFVFTSLKPALDRLHGAMEDVAAGDSYALTLIQGQVLVLERNGIEVLRLAEPELGRAYLDLWLGRDPLDERLRLSLLGSQSNS